MKTKKSISLLLTIILLTLLLPTQAQAQAPCLDHIVTPGEWLSQLAGRYLGNPLAYPIIVEATNAMPGYSHISNPDLIEPGWKLCIPNVGQNKPTVQEDSDEDGELLFWQWAIFSITRLDDGKLNGCLLRFTVDIARNDTEFLYKCRESGQSLTIPQLGPQS